jgi:chaperonin GroES
MFENIQPLYDRVLVRRKKDEEKTAGGLYIPDAAKDKAQTGDVIAVGEGRISTNGDINPLRIKKGDVVFFGKYVGTEAGDDYVILREDDILGTINK